MIFDDNLEMSERKYDDGPMTMMEPSKAVLKGKLQPNPYEGTSGQNTESKGFTLNKYESKPELVKEADQVYTQQHDGDMQTAHFKK